MKEIQTNGKTILLVEVPEDTYEFRMSVKKTNHLIYRIGKTFADCIDLADGQYQILGKSTELSEEQMKEIVEVDESISYWDDPNDEYYVNYNIKSNLDRQFFHTIQESYLSLLEANGIVDRNPITESNHLDYKVKNEWGELVFKSTSSLDKYSDDYDKWQEAQSKVKHYLVLRRI